MDKSALKKKAIGGAIWVFSERFVLLLVQLATTILLARLLGPTVFGTVAIVTVFIKFLQFFVDSGFGKALIQKRSITDDDRSTIFLFNMGLSAIIYIFIFFAAPTIASFYNQPKICGLLRVLAVNVVIAGLRHIHEIDLTRKLSFRVQFNANIVAAILSGTAGLIFALFDYGVWALVIQSISGNILRTLLYWFQYKWRPSLTFSPLALSSLLKFSSYMLLRRFLRAITDNIYDLLIGKFFSPGDLGLYNRAKRILGLVLHTTSHTIQKTTFPLYSKIQTDDRLLSVAFVKSSNMVFFAIVPVFIGVIVAAQEIILLLLGEQWTAAVPFLRLFCLLGIFRAYLALNNHLLLSKGRADVVFRLSLVSGTLQVSILIFSFRYGISVVILGQIMSALITLILTSIQTRKITNFGLIRQLAILGPYFLASVPMLLMTIAIRGHLKSCLLLLCFQLILPAGIYLVIAWMFSFEPLLIMKDFFQKKQASYTS